MSAESEINPFTPSLATRARVQAIRETLASGRGVPAVVIGAGKSGLAAAQLLCQRGCQVRICDDRVASLSPEVKAKVGGATIEALTSEALQGAELVVLSPGVPRTRPELKDAIARGVLVGEIELASWFVEAPLLAVTGTNGKSTTTALLAHLLEAGGKRVFAGGNLGRPLSELAVSGEKVDAAVIELSSYQLESIVDASFVVSCWLNLTPDHTDRYESVETYALAKQRIIERRALSGVAVLNASDPVVAQAGLRQGGPIRWFNAEIEPEIRPESAATLPGQFFEEASTSGTMMVAPDRAARGVEIYDLCNEALPGLHNRANMAAAIECARCFEIEPEAVQRGLLGFRGLPHRIELVSKARGARWYNDSKATNIDSAATAIRAVDGPKILIAGGRDKGASWEPLVALAPDHQVRAVLAVGEATELVMNAFALRVPVLERCGTVERAVARAAELVQPGDAVLLSPACASLDQFTNYEARGDLFRTLAQALEREDG